MIKLERKIPHRIEIGINRTMTTEELFINPPPGNFRAARFARKNIVNIQKSWISVTLVSWSNPHKIANPAMTIEYFPKALVRYLHTKSSNIGISRPDVALSCGIIFSVMVG